MSLTLSICMPTLDVTGERATTCLRSIRSTLARVSHEVVIVDNGGAPQGVSAPANAAIRAARGEHIVFCSDDVVLLRGWWPPLRDALKAGASIAFPTTVDGFMREDFAAWCFAMTRATINRYGAAPGEFFDLAMRVWYQDTDLYRRMLAADDPPVCVAASKIRHGYSQTINDPAHAAWVYRQIARDHQAFEARHGPVPAPGAGPPVVGEIATGPSARAG